MKNPTPTYSGKATHTARSADTSATPSILRKAPIPQQRRQRCGKAAKLCDDLTRSLRHPCGKTLRLLDRALKLLIPFESSKAAVTSPAEKQELLQLIDIHRTALCPYLDIDKIVSNLRFQ